MGFVVAATDDGVQVLEHRCTHRGGPLADGTTLDGCVEARGKAVGSHWPTDTSSPGLRRSHQPADETRIVSGGVEIRRTEVGGLRTASVRPTT